MKFDAATLREELSALEEQIKVKPRDAQLTNNYVSLARKLRQMEYETNGYVSSRSSLTGY